MKKRPHVLYAVDELVETERLKLITELIALRSYSSEQLEAMTLTELVKRYEALTGQSW